MKTSVSMFLVFVAFSLSGCEASSEHDRTPSTAPNDSSETVSASASMVDTETHSSSHVDTSSETSREPSCAAVDFGAQRKPVDVLIVLDGSHSMLGDEYAGQPNLWDPTVAALNTVTSATKDYINFGLITFPSEKCTENLMASHDLCTPPSTAEVPRVAIGTPDAAGAIASAMASIEPCGNTPTAKTLEIAKTYLDSVSDDLSRYVLLATDGGPNCNEALYQGKQCTCTAPDNQCNNILYNKKEYCLDEQGSVAAATSLFGAGYPVFVVGMSEAAATYASVMDSIAAAGGTEHFYAVNDPTDLLATFDEITGGIASCDFGLDWDALPSGTSKDPELINFYCKESAEQPLEEAAVLKRDPGCASGTGWDWKDSEKNTARLCSGSCDALKAGSCAVVTASFGCDTLII